MDVITKQAQDYYKLAPVILLGSGASAAYGLSGMWALANHLIKEVDNSKFNSEEQSLWNEFAAQLSAGSDLEKTLHQVNLTDAITKSIVLATWHLLNGEDLGIFNRAINDNNLFPLGKLLNHMFDSTHREIDIITTNYDRLAEYACDQEGLHHYTGFSHGFIHSLVGKRHLKSQRQVNIWKVHGSLDWFVNDGRIIGLGNSATIPDGWMPEIITPGLEKYRRTHREPFRTIIHYADDVLEQARAYLCVGFGFNDEHIQEKLVNRCVHDNARIILVTHGLTDAARAFLGECHEYLAIEAGKDNDHSIIHSSKLSTPIEVEGNYWSLEGFLRIVL